MAGAQGRVRQCRKQRDIQQILAPDRSQGQGGRGGAEIRQGLEGSRDDDRRTGPGHDRSRPGGAEGTPARIGRRGVQTAARQAEPADPKPARLAYPAGHKIVPATTQTFAQAKPSSRTSWKARTRLNHLANIGNQADDALAGGASLAETPRNSASRLRDRRGGRRERQRRRTASRSNCRSPATRC